MSSTRTIRRDFLLVACASISWGTIGIANQAIFFHTATNAASLAFLRLAIAALLFLAASRLLPGRRLFSVKRRDMGVLLLLGVLQALYQVCYNAAIVYAGVSVATLIALCVAPVVTALLSTLMMKERLNPPMFLALLLALGGTILLVTARSHPSAESASLPGVLFALLAAGGYAGFILGGRFLSSHYHPLHVNTFAFSVGALLLLCFSLLTGLVVTYSAQDWLLLLYVGSVPTALAYFLFQVGVRSLSATLVSIITLFEPLVAALLAWLLFHEELGPLGLLGAAMLLGAMLVILVVPHAP